MSFFLTLISNTIGISNWIHNFQNSSFGFLITFVKVIIWLVFVLLYFSIFKYVWMIICSPLLAILSEKTEAILTKKEIPFSWNQLVKDSARGINITLRNFIKELFLMLILLIATVIPLLGWLVPITGFLIECYFLGFTLLDYSCERHRLTTKTSINYIRGHKGLAIGNGMGFYFLHLLPIIGWIIAPTYSVVSATLSFYKTK